MDFIEKDLESIIYENIKENHDDCYNLGLTEPKPYLIKRQLKIGNYGKSDIVTLSKYGRKIFITLYELKLNCINIDTLIQSIKYIRGIERYMEKYHPNLIYKYRIVMIGKKIDDSNPYIYIFNYLNIDIQAYLYEYSLKGIKFKLHELEDYKLVNEGF